MRNRSCISLVLSLSCFIVVAAAAAILLGAAFLNAALPATPAVNVFKSEAAARGWPASTPADNPPWPDVTQWSEWSRIGYVRQAAWSAANRKTTHQMEVDRFGWPFPVFERSQLWRPWDDPKWASKEPSVRALFVRWDGVLKNGLIFGLPAFLLWTTPSFVRTRHRRKHGLCIECGYDLRGSPPAPGARCPECGLHIARSR